MKRTSRKPSTLSESVQQHLNAYALAASAAGVGMLALAQPSEARIIYTHTHVKVAPQSRYGIDLDHNGTPDVYLRRSEFYATIYLFASADPNLGNGVATTPSNSQVWAAAIFPGARIGPARRFAAASRYPSMAWGFYSTWERWKGPWANGGKGVKNHYLGIKFTSGGKFHYGWARVTVTIDNPKINEFSSVVLTGYAYETVPNKPIIAGRTKGPDVITLEPGSLGALAAGVSRLRTIQK